MSRSIHLLVVEDNPGDVRLVREALRDAAFDAHDGSGYQVTAVDRLAKAYEVVEKGGVDVILLDLALPDSEGFATFENMHARAGSAAIVVLTRAGDDTMGTRALRAGAQDYLSKTQFDGASLSRSLRYAVERKQAERDRIGRAQSEAQRDEADAQRIAAVASEAQIRSMAESMPQMVWRARADGTHDYLNARWYAYTGAARDDDARGHDWIERVHPDDRERARAAWSASVKSGEDYEHEQRVLGADGRYRWFLARALPTRSASGAITRWFGTYTDIDDQKRALRGLAVLAETGRALAGTQDVAATVKRIPRMLVPAVADWTCLYLRDERGEVRLAGCAHVDPARETILHEQFKQFGLTPDAKHGAPQVMRTGKPELLVDVSSNVMDVMTPVSAHRAMMDGLGPVSAMSVPLAVQGRVFGAMTFVSSNSERRFDSTDLALAEEIGRRVSAAIETARLFQLAHEERERAEQANSSKDEFLSVASHELRTPLNAILGWSRLLRAGTLVEDKRERALEIIERNAMVQVKLIEDILDVSRITSGKLRLELAPVDVMEVVEAAVDVVRPAAEAKGVRLTVTPDVDGGVLQGDAARLQQIVWNLAANAVKFTPRGGDVAMLVSGDADHVEIVVADTGLGMAPEFVPHVFVAFRQADIGSARSNTGLGLGLAIVKNLVELHGGRVDVTSPGVGRGSTFTARFPRSQRHALAERPETSDLHTSPFAPQGALHGIRVLAVDDQPDARELVQQILETCGAEVITASNAEEALARFLHSPPDVLVSDIGMPRGDGYQLIRRIRSMAPTTGTRTPAIALTAFASTEDRTRALREGYDRHVAKPIDPTTLVSVVAAAVGRDSAA